MNKKALLILCLILISVFLCACKQISQEEAVIITQNFVNGQVKFYVNEGEEAPVVQKADISLVNVYKQDNNWNVLLNIKSNHTGDLKQSNLLVVVDAKSGNVLDMKKVST
jgi:hypothetical protein